MDVSEERWRVVACTVRAGPGDAPELWDVRRRRRRRRRGARVVQAPPKGRTTTPGLELQGNQRKTEKEV